MRDILDNGLVTKLGNSDKTAFDVLYWRYHQRIYANVFKLIKNADQTEDIVQEVFVALWESRKSLDPSRDIAGWLFVVSYNKAITHLKKQLKESVTRATMSKIDTETAEASDTFSDTAFELLEKAIALLSPQKRKVFELCKLQGKTYEEAAKELNISKHTVKEYLGDAVGSIKEFIKSNPGHLSVYLLATMLPFLR